MTEEKNQNQTGLLERVFGEPSEEFGKRSVRKIGLDLTKLMSDGVEEIRSHMVSAGESAVFSVSPWAVKHYRVEWDWEQEGGISGGIALQDFEPNEQLTDRLVEVFSANRNLDVFFLLTQGVALFRRPSDDFCFLPGGSLPEVKSLGREAREKVLAETYGPFFPRGSGGESGVLASHKALLSPPPLSLELEFQGAQLLLEVTLRFYPLLVDEVARSAYYPVRTGLSVAPVEGRLLGPSLPAVMREEAFSAGVSEKLFKTMGLWALWSPEADGDSISQTASFLRKQCKEPASTRVTIEVTRELREALGLQEKALALLFTHPDWSVAKIAAAVGCSRTTPYKWPPFQAALEALKSGREELPRGEKSEGGDLEAWLE